MTVRVSAYQNKKGKVGVSISLSVEEAAKLSNVKGDGIVGEVAEALKETLNDPDSVAYQARKKKKDKE